MTTPLRKRRSSPKPSDFSPSKRRKPNLEDDIIVISDSEEEEIKDQEEDEELKDLLAQIKAQEESERYAKRLQKQFDLEDSGDDDAPQPGSSTQAPIDIDDAALAQRLAEEWAAEDDVISIRSFSEPDNHSSDVEFVDAPLNEFSDAHLSKSSVHSTQQNALASNSSRPSRNIPLETPDQCILPYRHIFVESRPCSKCCKPLALPRGLVTFSDSLCPESLTQLLHATCRRCKTSHCRGCFVALSCPVTCTGVSTNPACTVHTCCPEIRAIAVFSILESFDVQVTKEKALSETRTQALLKNNAVRKPNNSVGPGGTGYGLESSRGRGQGRKTPASAGKQKVANWQSIVIQAFKILVAFLPAPYSDTPQAYDILPHPSIGHLIALSHLPSILAYLLRNDSVSDWITQMDTYHTMLTLLRRMADSELTIQCLIGPRWEAKEHIDIGDWMRNQDTIVWNQDPEGKPEAQPPLYTHFRKLTLQSEAFLKGAQQMLDVNDSESDIGELIQGTSLAGDIIAARDDLERAISVIGRTFSPVDPQPTPHTSKPGKGKGRAIPLDPDTLYLQACEKLAFKHISLASVQGSTGIGLLYANFSYASNLKQTENSVRQPKDRLHLVKELAVTATSLPAGIWVRVDEVRNDAIKIMIAGPVGTPYAGGLFEFDCFMPIEYPHKPPLVHLRTTGGGSVRFNPNLYNDGKNDRHDPRPEEQWTSKSTLLQVLVSIQSMILVEAPYFNEPGMGPVNMNSQASIMYNRNICKQTVRWAIVEWFKKEHLDGIWRDVIASHFTIHKDKIRQQIVDWAASVPEIRGYTNDTASYYNYIHGASARRGPSQPHTGVAKRDLLSAFDTGMKLIESWKVGDAAG